MRLKSLIGIILWGGMLVSCGPDNRVVLAEKLMAEKETDSAIVVMNEIKEPCCYLQLNISANRAILFMPNGLFTAKHIWTDGLTG